MTTQTEVNDGGDAYGYTQTLQRSIGQFASFAAGVSYISVLTGVFGLFYFGFGAGGPAYAWSWPMVFAGQLMVALCFAELASHYPVAGSVYNWAKKLSGHTSAWLAGWLMAVSSIVTVSAVALTYQVTLPQIWSGFQIIGDGTGPHDFALNGVLLAGILIAVTTMVNAFGVRLATLINSIGVFVELVAAVLLIIILALHVVRGPGELLQTHGLGADHSFGYFGVFLIAAIASAWVMYGFDTASTLGEETKDPKRTAPRAIIRAITASFVLGGLILLFGILSAPDLSDPAIGTSTGGLQYIVLSVLGGTLGKLFLISVAVAITVCVIALEAAAIRMVFAMARDNRTPMAAKLAYVHPTRRTPTNASITVGVLAILILVVMLTQPQIYLMLASVGVALIYCAYLLVTIPMLRQRLRGEWPLQESPGDDSAYSLGRWGLAVNAVAIGWGIAMAINLLWPRREVYNPEPPFHWYYAWSGILFLVAVTIGGLLLYHFRLRNRPATLHGHTEPRTAPTRNLEPDTV
ncbi:APC family permease [Mycobacterium sp. 21AC1]|uniref:APC family permease n=1 Tax=[Mycobacterium] appelbergii TaxID=2939269 RepID=UPI00293915BF|nr:APC family permease [Mycobacterium sp. 21AC1]MDV3124451.1 APC family permease [Mycobacterium sp. 21AC1]